MIRVPSTGAGFSGGVCTAVSTVGWTGQGGGGKAGNSSADWRRGTGCLGGGGVDCEVLAEEMSFSLAGQNRDQAWCFLLQLGHLGVVTSLAFSLEMHSSVG